MDNNLLHSTILALSAATVMYTYIMLEEDEEDEANYLYYRRCRVDGSTRIEGKNE